MKFKARYEVDDGYVGKDRPQYFSISEEDIEDDMDDDQLEQMFYDIMQEEFEQHVIPYAVNVDEFVIWAKEVQNKIRK